MCLGRKVAIDSAFMQVARLLWAFDIEPIDGEVVDPWAMVVAEFMTMPREFKFKLRLRGDWVLGVIQREWAIAETGLDKSMETTGC